MRRMMFATSKPAIEATMIPFITVREIEDVARNKNRTAILLLMADYNNEMSGPIAELLHRADAYHYHSSNMTDILCAGYSDRDRSNEPELGSMKQVQFECRLKYFFPTKFHELRLLITTTSERAGVMMEELT
jgi:hypothetical protein